MMSHRVALTALILGTSLAGAPAAHAQSLRDYTLPPGPFYPGTSHTYSVHIPPGYDGAHTLPVTIFLDRQIFLGGGIDFPAMIDGLITRHDIPPMLTVFIDAGVDDTLPNSGTTPQNRYERAYEYDSITPRYGNFLAERLIPDLARHYKISDNPDDRALVGLSSSAVGAFAAAWNRPDQFHRVISFIGTYVAMKGADTLPALVRRTEPKPLRIFLQDGSNDHMAPEEPFGAYYAGNWPINNQVMYQDLKFAGYDTKYVEGDGSHDLQQGVEILPDVLRWTWRNYPQPITEHEPPYIDSPSAMLRGAVFSIISASHPWQPVSTQTNIATGPVGDDAGNVFYANTQGQIYRETNGTISPIGTPHGPISALAVTGDNRLLVAETTRRQIVSLDENGNTSHIVGRHITASGIAITRTGGLYITQPNGPVLYLSANGQTISTNASLPGASGITLTPDQAMAIVSSRQSRFAWSYQIAPDGTLTHGEPYYRLDTPDDADSSQIATPAVDRNGQVYFATPLGIEICEQNGRAAPILNAPTPDGAQSIALAGPNRAFLYTLSHHTLYRRPIKTRGIGPGETITPPVPPL